MNLRKKMVHGALWTLLGQGGQQFIQFTIFAILARLIGPEEFGLYSICFVLVTFSITIITGAADSIVSQRTEDDAHLSTLFWLVVGIGLLFSGFTYVLAGPFALLMHDARMIDLVHWLSLVPVLVSVSLVPSVMVQARMDFKIFTIRTLVSTFFSGLIGIYMAYRGAGAMSMIVQQIAQYLIINFIIWPSVRWMPSLTFKRELIAPALTPGLKMMGSLMFNFFETTIPRVVVGMVLGLAAAGHFAFVLRCWQVIREVFVVPVTGILFTSLALVNHDPQEMRKLTGEVTFMAGLVVFPALAGAITTAPLFIPLFFGPNWAEAIPVMQVFLLSVIFLPFLSIMRDILRVQKRTEIYLYVQVALFVLTMIALFVFVPQGLIVLCAALAVVSLLCYAATLFTVANATQFPLYSQMLRLWPFVLASLAMAGVIAGFDHYGWHPQHPAAHLAFSVVVGSLVYAALVASLRFKQIKGVLQHLKRKGAAAPVVVEETNDTL